MEGHALLGTRKTQLSLVRLVIVLRGESLTSRNLSSAKIVRFDMRKSLKMFAVLIFRSHRSHCHDVRGASPSRQAPDRRPTGARIAHGEGHVIFHVGWLC